MQQIPVQAKCYLHSSSYMSHIYRINSIHIWNFNMRRYRKHFSVVPQDLKNFLPVQVLRRVCFQLPNKRHSSRPASLEGNSMESQWHTPWSRMVERITLQLLITSIHFFIFPNYYTHPKGSFLVKVKLRLGRAWLMGIVVPCGRQNGIHV